MLPSVIYAAFDEPETGFQIYEYQIAEEKDEKVSVACDYAPARMRNPFYLRRTESNKQEWEAVTPFHWIDNPHPPHLIGCSATKEALIEHVREYYADQHSTIENIVEQFASGVLKEFTISESNAQKQTRAGEEGIVDRVSEKAQELRML